MGYTTCMNFPCLLYCENIYHQKKPIHNEDLLVQICKEITYFFVKYYFLQDLSYVFAGICVFVSYLHPPPDVTNAFSPIISSLQCSCLKSREPSGPSPCSNPDMTSMQAKLHISRLKQCSYLERLEALRLPPPILLNHI